MGKWLVDVCIGAAVLGVVLPILFALDDHRFALAERHARAEPSILEACTEVAAQARSPFFGAVKELCLKKFDRRYGQAREAAPHT
jgi:hypothetical protein